MFTDAFPKVGCSYINFKGREAASVNVQSMTGREFTSAQWMKRVFFYLYFPDPWSQPVLHAAEITTVPQASATHTSGLWSGIFLFYTYTRSCSCLEEALFNLDLFTLTVDARDGYFEAVSVCFTYEWGSSNLIFLLRRREKFSIFLVFGEKMTWAKISF